MGCPPVGSDGRSILPSQCGLESALVNLAALRNRLPRGVAGHTNKARRSHQALRSGTRRIPAVGPMQLTVSKKLLRSA